MFHEHIRGLFEPTPPPPAGSEMVPGVVAPKNEAEYLDLMVDELKMSREEGVACLVDSATGRRDERAVQNLRQLAQRSGMHIVLAGASTRIRRSRRNIPTTSRRCRRPSSPLSFIADAKAQQWGAFGEIASSPQMQPEERKLFRAIGLAHLKTNLPIFTHTPHQSCPSCALEQLDAFESVGVEPGARVHRTPVGDPAETPSRSVRRRRPSPSAGHFSVSTQSAIPWGARRFPNSTR